jgi:hypothetical protein
MPCTAISDLNFESFELALQQGPVILILKEYWMELMLLLEGELSWWLFLFLEFNILISNLNLFFELLIWVIDKVSHAIQFASQMDNHASQISSWCLINVTCKSSIIYFFYLNVIVFQNMLLKLLQSSVYFVSMIFMQLVGWHYVNSSPSFLRA